MKRLGTTIEIRVSREIRNHSATKWNLFAQYAHLSDAHGALARAEAQGYNMAKIVECEIFEMDSASEMRIEAGLDSDADDSWIDKLNADKSRKSHDDYIANLVSDARDMTAKAAAARPRTETTDKRAPARLYDLAERKAAKAPSICYIISNHSGHVIRAEKETYISAAQWARAQGFTADDITLSATRPCS